MWGCAAGDGQQPRTSTEYRGCKPLPRHTSALVQSAGAAVAELALKTVRFADRTGQVYGSAIYPDVQINAVRSAAVEWLTRLPECE